MDLHAGEGGEPGRERSIALIRTMVEPFRVIDWTVVDPGDDPYAAFCDLSDDLGFQRVRRRDGANAEGMFVTITEPPRDLDMDTAADMLVAEVNRVAREWIQVGFGYLLVPELCPDAG